MNLMQRWMRYLRREYCDLYTRSRVGKIGIIISHRISSIKDIVNKIVVFRDGQIEAIGSHAELLQSSETYKELYLDEIAESETE